MAQCDDVKDDVKDNGAGKSKMSMDVVTFSRYASWISSCFMRPTTYSRNDGIMPVKVHSTSSASGCLLESIRRMIDYHTSVLAP